MAIMHRDFIFKKLFFTSYLTGHHPYPDATPVPNTVSVVNYKEHSLECSTVCSRDLDIN